MPSVSQFFRSGFGSLPTKSRPGSDRGRGLATRMRVLSALLGALAVLLIVAAQAGAADFVGFAPGPDSPVGVGTSPFSVATDDLNGDGQPDLVTANERTNNVTVLLNNGDGSFAPGSAYDVGFDTQPRSVAIDDLNGDGKPDLVTANHASNNVTVLLNNGNGTFAPGSAFAVGTNPNSVAIDDLDHDGNRDLVTANYGSNNVTVLLNNGNGTFAPGGTFAAGPTPISVAIGDLDGDGKPDLVTANHNSWNVTVLLGNGSGSFALGGTFAAAAYPTAVAIGDLNGDGKLDLAIASCGSSVVAVLLNSGNGTFALDNILGVGANPSSVAIGDLNSDTKPDLATANYGSSNVTVWLGSGLALDSFALGGTFDVGSIPSSVAIEDLDGDTKPDLVTANPYSNNVTVLLHTTSVRGLKYEDLDGDGQRGAGEPGLQGFTIYVDYDDDGSLDTGEPSAQTDSNGHYQITGVTPGAWKVREVQQTGWTCSQPNPCYHAARASCTSRHRAGTVDARAIPASPRRLASRAAASRPCRRAPN